MEINYLLEYINLITMGCCLCIGYSLKTAFEKFPNKYIPLVAMMVGVMINILCNIQEISIQIILSGMVSGLASTGLYEMFRNLLNHK